MKGRSTFSAHKYNTRFKFGKATSCDVSNLHVAVVYA